jgi:adenine-specific DNA-methyltransferase
LINADKENKWWYLYGYRPNTNFNDEKIVLPYRAIDNSFAYSSEPFYASIDVFFVNVTDPKFKTKYISAILCSKLIEYWLNKNCKRKGKILELYQKPLSAIPIIYAEPKTQNQFVVNTDEILSRKKLGKDTLALEQQNNNMIYKLYDLTYDEVKVIDLEFCLTKIEYEAIKLE